MNLIRALEANSGVVSVVGAGGKKTTLYTLADRLATVGRRAVVTATVRIPIFDQEVETVFRSADPTTVLDSVTDWPVGIVPEREGGSRYRGYEPAIIDSLSESALVDVILVKADGARMRDFKAPGADEPRIPESTTTVAPIASVDIVGKPLTDEWVHRPERVAAITNRSIGDTIRPEDVSRVLASDRGGLKGCPEAATVVPILNKIDNDDRERTGHRIARSILESTARIHRVALTRMIAEEPLVGVVE